MKFCARCEEYHDESPHSISNCLLIVEKKARQKLHPQIRLDGHCLCPYCGNITLSNLNKYPSAIATICKYCKKIVTRREFIITNSKMLS